MRCTSLNPGTNIKSGALVKTISKRAKDTASKRAKDTAHQIGWLPCHAGKQDSSPYRIDMGGPMTEEEALVLCFSSSLTEWKNSDLKTVKLCLSKALFVHKKRNNSSTDSA